MSLVRKEGVSVGKDAAFSSSAAIFAPKPPAVTRRNAAFTGFTPTPTNSWNRKGRQLHLRILYAAALESPESQPDHGLSQYTDSQSDASVVLLHKGRLGDLAVGGAGT